MKREIKDTKKNLIPKPKVKVSDAKTPVKKPESGKIEKKAVAVKSKTEKKSAAIINQKNKLPVKKTPVKPSGKTEGKNKSTTAKEKTSKPKMPKKSVIEAKAKKTEAIKKSAVAKQTVKAKTQIKVVKPVAKKKIIDVSKTVKPKIQKKIVANIKTDKPEAKKSKLQTKSEASVKKVKTPEQKAVAEKIILPKKPVNKKAKPISSAVLRGKKGRYDFEVFPLDANFEAVSAIYVITKRITDKRKRGHHKLVCIGQTESIVDGIKMHKKDKCIKQNEANVICLLKEESEKNRLKITADLREAHTISCNRQ